MTESTRPARPRILDELGLPKSLPASAADFAALLGPGPDVLLLGLGPEPERLPELLGIPAGTRVAFVECPDMAAQLGQSWRARIPGGWRQAQPGEVGELAAGGARVVLYRPGPRLFPGFFGPVAARLASSRMKPAAVDNTLVWLPGGEGDLLRRELAEGFAALGLRVRLLPPDADPRALLAGGERPALYFSVNFQGLDPLGETAHLLAAAGCRVAAWCVDNPLHLVSGLKARFWMDLPLFVTDGWFLPVLRGLGARRAAHLPLAARARDLELPPAATRADLAGRLVFAGRSAFPGKEGFFAGCILPAAAWTEAQRGIDAGSPPHFGWWLERLGIDRLWPGADVRRAGFCAEETGRAWRAACLNRAAQDVPGGVLAYGDEGWRELLGQGVELRPPVDYYGEMPGICASAAACLNCTSPLLPHGLTQRHFDVWAWGGLLVSDATPGLGIFPEELTRPMTFSRPEHIAATLRRLLASADGGAGLKAAWRDEIAARHTYAQRAGAVLDAVGLG